MGNCYTSQQPIDRVVSTEKLGKSVAPLPWGLRGIVYNGLVAAETQFGRPVKRNEVYNACGRYCGFKIPVMPVFLVLKDLYRNDEILCDANQHFFSANRQLQETHDNQTGFELFSDRI